MNFLVENWMMKLLSLVFALVLWFFVMGEQNLEQGYAVPVSLTNIPEGLIVSNDIPSLIDVRISGPRTILMNLQQRDLAINIDLKGLAPGVTSYKRLEERFNLSRNLKVTRTSPSVIAKNGSLSLAQPLNASDLKWIQPSILSHSSDAIHFIIDS